MIEKLFQNQTIMGLAIAIKIAGGVLNCQRRDD
jgi:hypothetical protein